MSMWPLKLRVCASGVAAVAGALLSASCTDDTGPGRGIVGYFALEPVFVSEAAGIVPVNAGRFVLRRIADNQVVKDTVVALSPAADSVDLTFSVQLQGAGETFALTIALVNAAGDTVFRGGPVTVSPSTGGTAPVAVTLPIQYTGVGFDAASLVILSPDTTLPFGAGATFTAQARDAEGVAIPGTPVQWRALDSARVSVVRQDSGRVLARTQRGPARVVARLLTGPADTIQVTVRATPNSIAAESGGNQTGPAGVPYPQPLVARVLAVDDGGVDGVWVSFTVLGGGGILSADSVLTDANGRAAVTLTPGTPGPQSVGAAVSGVSGTALFTATAVSAGPRTVMWTNPAGGSWSTGANWSTGSVPGSQDTAVIALAGTYGVTVDVNVTLQQLIVGGASGLQSLVQSANTLAVENASFGPNARYLLSGSGGLAGLVPASGTVTVSGIVQWSGGAIAHGGTVRIAPGGALNVTGGTATLRNGILANQGTLTWLGGNVTLADGSQIRNEATINVLADGGLQFGGGGGGTFINTPTGTFNKSVTTGNTVLIVPATNNGQMNITTGSLVFGNNLSFAHDGPFSGGPGTVLSFGGTGTHVLDSTITGFARVETSNVNLTLNGTVATGHLSVGAFGDITVNAPLLVDSVTVQRGLMLSGGGPHTVPYLRLAGGTINGNQALAITDSLIWTGGGVTGPGLVTLQTGAIARLTTAAAKSVVGPLRFDGSVFWTGGVLAMDGDGVLNVGAGGLLDMQGDLTAQFGTGGAVIDVAGTFRKSAGTGTGTVNPHLVVSGVLDAGSGTLDLNGDVTLAAGSVIHGDGALDVSGATTVTLDGVVSPGNSPAQLAWVGPFRPGQASALEIELGGVTVGTGYDQLSVNGTAAPAGTLNVTLINGFVPQPGQQFTILSAGGITGDFADVSLPLLPLGLAWDRTTIGTAIVLTVISPPAPIVFAGDSAGGLSSGVFRVNADGTGQFRVTPEGPPASLDTYPRWSPDRTRITYSANPGAEPNQLHVISADGRELAHLTSANDTSTRRPRYSPDGRHLAFECGDGQYPVSPQDVCVVLDVTGPILSLNGIGIDAWVTDSVSLQLPGSGTFAWNPVNPDQLIVVRDSSVGQRVGSQFWLVNFDGTNPAPINGQVLVSPVGDTLQVMTVDWSPRGAFVVFDAMTGGRQVIFRLDLGSGALTQLTNPQSQFELDFRPVVSPDGTRVIFGRTSDGFQLYQVPATGGGEFAMTPLLNFNPDQAGWDWSPDGSEIVLTEDVTPGGVMISRIIPTTIPSTFTRDVRPAGRRGLSFEVQDRHATWRP